jgi:hypothetical protein
MSLKPERIESRALFSRMKNTSMAVLFWLSCPGCPVPAVRFRLSSSGRPDLVVLFWLFWFREVCGIKFLFQKTFFSVRTKKHLPRTP